MTASAPAPDQSLSDAELDRLDALLASFGENAMTAEELDGFFAALVCGPVAVTPVEHLAVIRGADEDEELPPLGDAEFREFSALAQRHWNHLAGTLARGEVWAPVMDTDENGRAAGNGWALGFLCGVEMHADSWEDFLEDEGASGAIVPMFALAHEDDPDPELRAEPIADDKREDFIATMMLGLGEIHAYFAAQRANPSAGAAKPATVKREGPKVGRNDPCPCGSGKKYKACCGSNADN
jgi:uncharacterized protein